MNQQEQFLKDTEQNPNQIDVLEAPINPESAEGAGEGAEGAEGTQGQGQGEGTQEDFQPRNRRERRLAARLQAERESSMFLAGKLEARTEAQRAVSEEADYLKAVEQIYGNATPEAQLATELLKKAIVGAREEAKEMALAEIREERTRESQELAQAETELDSMIDDIEETYGVDLTEAQERGFFQLLERMSPKDAQGNVIEYADAHAVWDVFKDKLKSARSPETNRAKDLSSRSMVNSGASAGGVQNDTMARFLAEQGII